MDLLIYIGGAVAFFILVMASIGLHEIGHLVPGKLFNVKTTEYFVGFGRKVWSRRRGGTEYGVRRFQWAAMSALSACSARQGPSGQVREYSTGPFRALADNARAAEWSTIQPEDNGRLFYQKPFWQKLIIMASGPAMNILLAFVILLGVAATYGVYRSQLTISEVGVHCRCECARPDLHREAADPGRSVGNPAGRQDGGVQRKCGVVMGRRFAPHQGKPGPPGACDRRAKW